MAAITAKSRAQLRLEAVTKLAPDEALRIVKAAAGTVKGGGVSLLTSGVQNLGAQVHVETEASDRLGLSINSGKRIIELCTFSATAVTSADGRTTLRVGGLETYKTSQEKFLALIPMGPKSIAGIAPYKAFLDAVKRAVLTEDTDAEITVAVPAPVQT